MRDVEDELVSGGVEHAVERHRELDDAKVGAEVATDLGAAADDGAANLGAEDGHGLAGQRPHVGGGVDALKIHVPSLVAAWRRARS